MKHIADHWGGAPKVDKVVTRFIPEANTQVAELQAGRIDIATLIPFGLAPTVEKSPNLTLVSITGPTVVALRLNTKEGITKDVNVRKALIMGVDRDAIIKAVLLGHAKPIASFQSDLSFGYDTNLKPLPFDLAKAKQMLQEAKVPAGAPVRIDFRGNDATFREVAQAAAGYFQALGLKPSIQPHEPPVLLNDIIPNGKTGEAWHNSWGGWTFDYDNTAYLMYHSGEKWNPYDNDPKLNALLEKQRTIYDVKEREKVLQEVARYVADQALEIPLYNQNTVYGRQQAAEELRAAGGSALPLQRCDGRITPIVRQSRRRHAVAPFPRARRNPRGGIYSQEIAAGHFRDPRRDADRLLRDQAVRRSRRDADGRCRERHRAGSAEHPAGARSRASVLRSVSQLSRRDSHRRFRQELHGRARPSPCSSPTRCRQRCC